MSVEAALAADERREAREAYRRAGGSARRPLKSFYTQAEKKAAREAHAETIAAAVRALQTPEGFRDWLGSLILCEDLSPLNCAIVAASMPGQIVTTKARWRARGGYSIRKGETSHIAVTGPGFVPRAAWTAEQVGATDLVEAVEADPPRLPDQATLDGLFAACRARLAAADKPNRVVAAYGEELRSGALLEAHAGEAVTDLIAAAGSDDELPF